MPIALDPQARPLDHLALFGRDDAPALILRTGVLTYNALKARISILAGWLANRVPQKGARVASWTAKGELTCLLPLAAARAGLVHVPINPLLKRAQAAHILADCRASLLLGNEARLASLQAGDIPTGCTVFGEDEAWSSAEALGSDLPPSGADPEDLVAVLYTSGSTGKPKGVMLSHANLWLGAVSVAHYLGLEEDDRVLAVLPLAFDYGQNQLLSAWRAGACAVPLDYLTGRDVVKACEKHAITTLAAVPPLWVQLLEQEWPETASSPIRRITNSGGPLTAEMVRRLRNLFPQADIFPMYGLTEAFRSTFLDPKLVESHPTSIGTAIPFAEVLVIGDDGDVTQPDEEGELVHCGPLVAKGYWNDEDRAAERFRTAPAGSTYGGLAVWSGDRVVRDAEGLLHFVGRRDAMIKSAGNRISPQEVEEAAMATGLAAEAVAVGVPDERLGQAVHLVLRGDAASEGELHKALMRELPNFMLPQAFHWREALPLNPNGKLDRARIVADLQAELAG